MKLSPKAIDALIKFSDNFNKLSAFKEGDSKEERLEHTQKEWYLGAGATFLPDIKKFTKSDIDASTGSSAFAPDDNILKDVTDLSPGLLPEYHNHLPQDEYVKAIEKYFKQIAAINKSTKIKQDIYGEAGPTDYFSMIGAGTTQLFTASLQSIIKSKDDVVIFATPTYGLFLPSVLSTHAKIVSLPLTKKNNYKPSASELKKLIQDTQIKLKAEFLKKLSSKTILVNALLASTKSSEKTKLMVAKAINRLSVLLKSNKAEMSDIDKACKEYHQTLSVPLHTHFSKEEALQLLSSLELPPCPRVRAYFHINPHMPMGTICNQQEVNELATALQDFKDVIVYDDLTYYDLIMPDAKTKAGTFAKSPFKDRTLTLYSISKQFALAAARAGIALGPKFLLEPIVHHIFETTNSPNILTLNAVYSVMTSNEKERTTYLSETLEEYEFRRDFTIALIEGMKNNHPKSEKITNCLKDLKVNKTEQSEMLKGINKLNIVLKPASGYFVLIDFSAYKGLYLGTVQLNHSRDFRQAFQALADVNTIPGELMYDFDKPILRFSYSMEPRDIMEGLLRIKSVLSLMQKHPLKPEEVNTAKKDNPKKVSKTGTAKATVAKQFTQKEHTKLFVPQFEKAKQQAKKDKSKAHLPKASLRRGRSKRKVIPTPKVL